MSLRSFWWVAYNIRGMFAFALIFPPTKNLRHPTETLFGFSYVSPSLRRLLLLKRRTSPHISSSLSTSSASAILVLQFWRQNFISLRLRTYHLVFMLITGDRWCKPALCLFLCLHLSACFVSVKEVCKIQRIFKSRGHRIWPISFIFGI